MPVTSLYRRLKNEDGDLGILIDLIQAVHRSSDLEEVYKVALDSAIKLENIDVIVVYLVDEERHEAVLESYRNLPEDYIKRAARIPYPKGVTWKVINSGKMLNVEDVRKDFDLGPAGRDMRYHGALGIPILLEKRVIGVIWFLSYREHKFDEKEVSLLSALGDQIAIAIAKAKYTQELIKTHESLKKQNDRLSLLSRISQEVHQFIDLDKIYTTFLDTIRNLSFVSLVFVYIIESKERQEALLQAHYVSNNTNFNLLSGIPYLKEITFKVMNSGKFGYYKSASDLPKRVTYIGAAFEKRTLLSVPIKLGNQTLGAIHLFSEEGKPFTEQDVDFLLPFVNQFGMAIAKAKMLEEIKKNKEKLRESERRYNVLAEHIYDLIGEIGADARFLFVSSGYKDILGYDPDELLGRNILENIHPDDQPAVMAEFARAVKTLSSGQAVYRYRHKDGGWLWLKSIGKPFKTATGEIRGVVASQNITDHRRPEDASVKSKKPGLKNNPVENKIIMVGIVTTSLILREGIYKMLESAKDIKVIDVRLSYLDVVSTIEQEKIDVLIFDTSFQEINFRDLLQLIFQKKIKMKVLLLFQKLNEEMIVEAISLGCSGVLAYESSAEQLVKAVRTVNENEIWADRRVISEVLTRFLPLREEKLKSVKSVLTKREEEILELLTQGYSNKYISQKLLISGSTLKSHITRIFRKLNVNNRIELLYKLHDKKIW